MKPPTVNENPLYKVQKGKGEYGHYDGGHGICHPNFFKTITFNKTKSSIKRKALIQLFLNDRTGTCDEESSIECIEELRVLSDE